jgi:8-oxo-dGTP pyrophosphatase MutT (NUDIX family)
MDYKFRDGIHCIVFRTISNKKEFLILHRVKNWVGWEFPKGGIKTGENHKEALVRELKEECGINQDNISLILPANSSLHIDYPKKLWKKAGFKGASYKNFWVEVNPKTKCTIKKNYEPEHDDIKWILETEATKYLDHKLIKSINDSDKTFDGLKRNKINMEKSVGAIVVNSRNEYLLLKRADKEAAYWEFPKGHKEKGETDKVTLARELREECNITKFEVVKNFIGKNEYISSSTGNTRIILLYLVKVKSDRIKLSKEHSEYAWLGLESALKKLNHENWRGILSDANSISISYTP